MVNVVVVRGARSKWWKEKVKGVEAVHYGENKTRVRRSNSLSLSFEADQYVTVRGRGTAALVRVHLRVCWAGKHRVLC